MKIYIIAAVLIFCIFFAGCSLTNNPEFIDNKNKYELIDTKKASEAALDYLNGKYDKEFYVVSSEKEVLQGYLPGSVHDYWVEVTVAVVGDDPKENYQIRLRLKDDNENYYIVSDSYMTSLVFPWVKEQMDNKFAELKLSDYFTILDSVSSKNCEEMTGDFPVIHDDDKLNEIVQKNNMNILYTVNMPYSLYSNNLTNGMTKLFVEYFKDGPSCNDFNSSICIDIIFYNDEDFSEYKKSYDKDDSLIYCGREVIRKEIEIK